MLTVEEQREISVNKTLVHIKDLDTKKYVFKYQTPKTKNSIQKIPMQDSVYKALKRQRIQLKKMQLLISRTLFDFLYTHVTDDKAKSEMDKLQNLYKKNI